MVPCGHRVEVFHGYGLRAIAKVERCEFLEHGAAGFLHHFAQLREVDINGFPATAAPVPPHGPRRKHGSGRGAGSRRRG